MVSASDVEAYLHARIPLSRQMQVRVTVGDGAGVRIAAPLAPNVDHRGTVFGGSASAVAMLAGWAQVHARIAELPFETGLVIRRAGIEYDLPIDGDFEAWCPTPGVAEWTRFDTDLRRGGKGRVELGVELQRAGRTVASFQGVYVALRG